MGCFMEELGEIILYGILGVIMVICVVTLCKKVWCRMEPKLAGEIYVISKTERG